MLQILVRQFLRAKSRLAKDQLGERGQAGAKYYYARLDDAPAVGPVIATTRIVDLFGTLPNPADRPPGGWKALGKS